MSEAKEQPHWHCNKRWTDINRTKEALSILESKFQGKTWSEGNQAFYAILLNRNGLSDSTNPRSTRAILGTFKFFGFAWTDQRKILITPAGREFIHGNVSDILRLQLLKWQYPNPFEAKGVVAPYTRVFRLFPFRVLLRLILELGYIHEDELALFVWKTQNDTESELERVKKDIQAFRKLSDGKKREACQREPLYITNHEYEAHLRPYIVATGLCRFDDKKRFLYLVPSTKREVRTIVSDKVKVKTDWRDEEEWFEYFGDTRYQHPPRRVELKVRSRIGPVSGVYVKVRLNGSWGYGVTNEDGTASFSLYEDQSYDVEVILPKDGSSIFKGSVRAKPGVKPINLQVTKAPPSIIESLNVVMDRILQLLSKSIDDELDGRLKMLSTIGKRVLGKNEIRYIRGARFEQLIYKLLNNFTGTVFDKVVWHGKVREWGIPIPAQKVSEETGKKLPDILVFQNNDVYVVETTLLRGRAQWEKPEAVSVPEHVENMIYELKGKRVSGLFIAGELDSSVQTNLVTRALNQGYRIVPIETEEFLRIVKLLETSDRSFWKSNFDNLWSIHRRNVIRRGPS